MCGIVSYFSNRLFKDALFRSLDLLGHRGPDGRGTIFFKEGKIGLGHTRLSIVDVLNGHQPLFSEDGFNVAVVNGELYGYQRIRQDFIARGYNFRTQSDSEIILPLYTEYGLRFLEHLRGEYSFVLYDRGKNLVIAGRDRFGIKPLYYTKTEHGLFLASEIKAFSPFGINFEWNMEAIWLSEYFIPSQSQSYFKNIFSIKPGHIIIYDGESLKEIPYWDFSYPLDDASTLNEKISKNEYIKQFEGILRDAVKVRLQNQTSIAYYISGGLDSASIIALAAQELQKPLTAFNICFEDPDYDESALSFQTAQFLGAEYIPVDVNSQKIASSFEDAVYHNEGLIHNCQGIAKFILSQAVHKAGYKAVLTGEGADEVLAGYPFFREDMLRYKGSQDDSIEKLRKSNQSVGHLFLSNEDYDDLFQNIKNKLGYIPSMWRIGAHLGSQFEKNFYTKEYSNLFSSRNPFDELIQTFDVSFKSWHPLNRSLYLWGKTNLPGVILGFLGDRMEMAHSVEGRLPFLDHHVVEFCQKLPISLKINQMTEKYLLREAVKDFIPNEIYQRQKFPFTAPPIITRTPDSPSPLQIFIFDLIHSQAMADIPFYDRKRLIDFTNQVSHFSQRERALVDPILNRVASAIVLAKKYKISQ
jgi:asparagine synthase (glutamine-hydrolysing)